MNKVVAVATIYLLENHIELKKDESEAKSENANDAANSIIKKIASANGSKKKLTIPLLKNSSS